MTVKFDAARQSLGGHAIFTEQVTPKGLRPGTNKLSMTGNRQTRGSEVTTPGVASLGATGNVQHVMSTSGQSMH